MAMTFTDKALHVTQVCTDAGGDEDATLLAASDGILLDGLKSIQVSVVGGAALAAGTILAGYWFSPHTQTWVWIPNAQITLNGGETSEGTAALEVPSDTGRMAFVPQDLATTSTITYTGTRR